MKLCVVGIGGCGGKVAECFLKNEDLSIKALDQLTRGEYISAGGIKGIWLESDKDDAENIQTFFGDLKSGAYPGFFIPHDEVTATSKTNKTISSTYGYDVKKQGYFRDAQYLKAIYEIFETDGEIRTIAETEFDNSPTPIFERAWKAVMPYTTLGKGDCDGILFIISLGGGTGTGFVNPIVNYIRGTGSVNYPVFVLAVLTEKGDLADTQQFAKESRRNLSAISSMYDMVTKSDGVDALILVDNHLLLERFNNFAAVDKYLYEAMRPMIAGRDFPYSKPPSLALRQLFTEGLSLTPIVVPCFWSERGGLNSEADLVEKALTEGKLCGCDPAQADWACVFSRGYLASEEIRKAVMVRTGAKNQIPVWRKLGEDGRNEVLILLRNPYGTPGIKENTLEHRLHGVIKSAIEYIGQNVEDNENRRDLLHLPHKSSSSEDDDQDLKLTKKTIEALEAFFYGEGGLRSELAKSLVRIENGEKPFFSKELKIFDGAGRSPRPDEMNNGFPEGVLTEEQMKVVKKLVKKEVSKLMNGGGSDISTQT
jgi:hypothetical protein